MQVHCQSSAVHSTLASFPLPSPSVLPFYLKIATILVDGLPKSQTRWFGKELRKLQIRTRKVRGVRKEEADALIRLADALCGFTRAAISGRQEFIGLLEKAEREGYIRRLE
jgi:hypothetical protein